MPKKILTGIVVSDKPKILNATSLQLILNSFNEFKISSFVNKFRFSDAQTADSSIKPCSIPR